MMSKPTSHKITAAESRAIWIHFPGRNGRAFHGEPRTDRGESKGDAEEDVSVIGEPLGERIKADQHEGDRGKVKTEGIQKVAGGHQSCAG